MTDHGRRAQGAAMTTDKMTRAELLALAADYQVAANEAARDGGDPQAYEVKATALRKAALAVQP